MPIIMYKAGVPVCQVEVPANKGKGDDAKPTERSREGAIHVSPGRTDTVTADELDALNADPQTKGHIHVLVKDESTVAHKDAPQEPEAVKPPTPAPAPAAAAATETAPATSPQATAQPSDGDKLPPKPAARKTTPGGAAPSGG